MADKSKEITNEIADLCISSVAMKHMQIDSIDQTIEGYRIIIEDFDTWKKYEILVKEIK